MKLARPGKTVEFYSVSDGNVYVAQARDVRFKRLPNGAYLAHVKADGLYRIVSAKDYAAVKRAQ